MASPEKVLCISDLHLSAEHPEIANAFSAFLQNTAVEADALFILGDFFNAWIGDDDPDPFSAEVKTQLKTLSCSGVAVFIMHGNRDFLLGETFCSLSGATLINEPYTLQVGESEYLLMHGDALCTRDTDYMAFRAMVRNPDWQADFLAKPLEERQAFAAQAREQSKAMSSNKAEDIMDVTEDEVTRLLQQMEQTLLVHGHTHRPAEHDLTINGIPGKRIVLGDWNNRGWMLEITPQGYSLRDFPILN